MSGGSFDYLYLKEFYVGYPLELPDMASTLRDMGSHNAARDTETIITRFNYLNTELSRLLTPELLDVWHAVEWYKSCDWGLDQANEVLDKYEQRTQES